MNGIREDYITPFHALDLDTWLIVRSNADTVFTRSQSSDIHAPSGQEWWKVAARGHLEQLYPDLGAEIWNTLPNSTSFRRQEDEDIRARPLFANYLDADILISLHTNASNTNPEASGTRVYTHPGRADDLALGTSMLCYMKEIIQAQEGYDSFPVQSNARTDGNYGENRLALMPAVVVEIAFHTNAGDAAALQDPVFQGAAMKGIEKGYRLHEEGEPCEPFDITDIPDSTGPHGGRALVDVYYEGFPQYPLQLVVELVTCPPGYTCTPGQLTITEESMPVTYGITCSTSPGSPPATATWRTTLTDDDGVETTSVDHDVTCAPGATSDKRVLSSDMSLIRITQDD